MNEQSQTPDPQDPSQQPVAYDTQGRPLYAHPAGQAPVTEAQPPVVHVARPIEPEKPTISLERQRLHERSQRLYPFLNLSEGEYIIRVVRRHPIGLVFPLAIGTLVIGLLLSLLFNYDIIVDKLAITGPLSTMSAIAVPILVLSALVALGMFVSYYVYVHNKFYLTNESVIQENQLSLFSHQEQTVSLENVEDASYTQQGILQQLFNYGNIRLSTQGDETTYRFSYVSDPDGQIAVLNNAVEAFKNGRPVDGN